MAKISVLGSGSWGLALALLLHKNGQVPLTEWDMETIQKQL